MRREFHVRFCESPEGQFLRATRLIILVSAPPGPNQWQQAREAALREKEALATFLREQLGLELSATKTLVTPVTEIIRFLGHHVRVRRHPVHHRMVSAAVIPKDRSQRIREIIKRLFKPHTRHRSLGDRLYRVN
jgi:hypothetical protein